MIRNIAGSVLALAGAAAAVRSPFRAWYDGRPGRDYAIDELFTGITDAKAELFWSILLPFLFAALVTVLGVVLRSRLLVAFAGLVVLGFTVLWMVRVGMAEGSLTVGGDGTGLGPGVATAFGGGIMLLLAALLMSGRHHAPHRTDRMPRPTPPPPEGPPPGGPPPDGPPPDDTLEEPLRHPQASTPYAATRTFDVPTPDPERENWENPPPKG